MFPSLHHDLGGYQFKSDEEVEVHVCNYGMFQNKLYDFKNLVRTSKWTKSNGKKQTCSMKLRNLCWPQQHACALASIVTMYTTEERIFLVASFIETKSYVQVQRAFLAHFKCSYHKKPSRCVIQCLIQKFYATGSVLDNKKEKVDSKWTVQMEEKKEEARALMKENPRTSLTRLVQQLGFSKTTSHSSRRHRVISLQGTHHAEIECVQKSEMFAICQRIRCTTCWKTKHA